MNKKIQILEPANNFLGLSMPLIEGSALNTFSGHLKFLIHKIFRQSDHSTNCFTFSIKKWVAHSVRKLLDAEYWYS